MSNIVSAFYSRWRGISSRARRLTRRRALPMLRAMAVLVRYRGAGRARVRAHTVRRLAERMLLALELEQVELSILLCDDASMRALNRRYRRLDRTTDVLAFAMREGKPMTTARATNRGTAPALRGGAINRGTAPALRGGALMLGDVVISLEAAARQARENGCDLRVEVTALLAHGLLHLLGFDHQTAAAERRMRARADALVASARAD